jgi:integrase
MKSRPKGRRAPRIVKRTLADGTEREYRYAPYKAKPRAKPTDTIDALIEAYRRSPEWDILAPNTQTMYAIYLRELGRYGDALVATVRRRDILMARDLVLRGRGPGAAQGFIRAASAVFKWAVRREWIEHTPVTEIEAIGGGELRAWTAQEANAAEAGLPERLRRVVILARYTGQRRGDLCAMTWAAFDGDTIKVRQQKVRRQQKAVADLVIPCHPRLREELATWRTDPVVALPTRTILTNTLGRPWRPQHLSHELPQALGRIGLSTDLNVHGLRKLAATSLADAGCTPHEIAAITGHRTLAMVEYYTRTADQERLARSAVVKLSERKTRTNGNTG